MEELNPLRSVRGNGHDMTRAEIVQLCCSNQEPDSFEEAAKQLPCSERTLKSIMEELREAGYVEGWNLTREGTVAARKVKSAVGDLLGGRERMSWWLVQDGVDLAPHPDAADIEGSQNEATTLVT